MHRLNINISSIPNGELTPKTPEIVNSLLAMRNPLDSFQRSSNKHPIDFGDNNQLPETKPPSIQHTCSQLIKEGLKLTIQTKRRQNSGSSMDLKRRGRKKEYSSSEDYDSAAGNSNDNNGRRSRSSGHLTPEDEERRRRRRERNKIAATKCRLKKRRKTVILVQESEILETQNSELKQQIDELETQRRRLIELLHLHDSNCIKNNINTYQEDFGPSITILQGQAATQPEYILPIKHEDYYNQS